MRPYEFSPFADSGCVEANCYDDDESETTEDCGPESMTFDCETDEWCDSTTDSAPPSPECSGPKELGEENQLHRFKTGISFRTAYFLLVQG